MTPKRKHSRIYSRHRGGVLRYYGDFRDFADVGGKQEALIARGERRATTDADIAQKLTSDRLQELERRRRNKALLGIEREAGLRTFAAHHLREKARSGRITEDWLEEQQRRLEEAVAFFGADRDLANLCVIDVQGYLAHLQRLPNGRGGTLSGGTIRHYLNALSNLYRRAAGEAYVAPGYNPVAALMDKPTASHTEARWLEVHEAALVLESARTYQAKRDDVALGFAYPLLATFLLTGGRTAEVLGLEAEDVSFDRKTVTFRPNAWRRLKTTTSLRAVPLWPQLEEILRPYVFGADAPPGRLLFPSLRTGDEAMITDFRKLLDAVTARVGWKPGEIRSKMFRHTYCAARLQTLDRGAPVSIYTVSRELGHGSPAMVQRVYSHLGEMRHRSEVVEYRVDQHQDAVGGRLRGLKKASGRPAGASGQ